VLASIAESAAHLAATAVIHVGVLLFCEVSRFQIEKADRATRSFPKRERARRDERRAEGLVRERESEQVSRTEVGADLWVSKRVNSQFPVSLANEMR
jgi:hypothetical protein